MADLPIFYADDAEDALIFMKWAITRAQLPNPLITAKDGLEAQQQLQVLMADANCPGLIILDVKMPFMNGLEVLRWLRADPAYAAIITVMLSTSDIHEDIVAAKALGADGYFLKRTRKELEETVKILAPHVGSARSGNWLEMPVRPASIDSR